MFIKNFAKVFAPKNTDAENTRISVVTYNDNRTLWSGKAKHLKDAGLDNYIVVEMLVDQADTANEHVYNKAKILKVM